MLFICQLSPLSSEPQRPKELRIWLTSWSFEICKNCFWVLEFSGLLIGGIIIFFFLVTTTNWFLAQKARYPVPRFRLFLVWFWAWIVVVIYSCVSWGFGMFADCMCRATVLISAEMGKNSFVNSDLKLWLQGITVVIARKPCYLDFDIDLREALWMIMEENKWFLGFEIQGLWFQFLYIKDLDAEWKWYL